MTRNKRWHYIVDILKKNNHTICAEIGIWRGAFTFYLLNNLPGIEKYHCIDLWKHYDDHTKTLEPKGKIANADMDKIYEIFKLKTKKFGSKISIYRMKSVNAAELIADDSLDFIFIDANHAYEYVKEDIKIWFPKVKNGGIISGHDYGDTRFGVTEAVNEYFDDIITGINKVWWKVK